MASLIPNLSTKQRRWEFTLSRSRIGVACWLALIVLACVSAPYSAWSQPAVQFPSTTPSSTPGALPTGAPPGYPPPSYPPPSYPAPYTPATAPPGSFAPQPNPYTPTFQPSTAPTAYGAPTNPGFPTTAQPIYPPGTTVPGTFNPAAYPPGTFPPGAYPQGAYPPGAYPQGAFPSSQPPVLYPGTPTAANPYGFPPNSPYPTQANWWTTTTSTVQAQAQETIRLCQGFRFRYTYLPGNGDFASLAPNDLASNDAELSFVFAIPKFLGCSQPLYIMPSYTQTLWEGPSVPGVDLPGAAFGAFVDSSMESDPMNTVGWELGVRVGVFSAFDAVSTESIRYPFKALARARMTPNATGRAGIYYIDRNKIKLLPALGVLWVPNPDTRWDIFFPEPKFSHYLTTHGQKDVWWYVTGYYGGGAWTIKDADGSTDEFDLNDIRILLGFECGKSELLRQGFRSYFFEVGYAFNRQLVFVNNPQNDLDLGDSLVFRAGFGY